MSLKAVSDGSRDDLGGHLSLSPSSLSRGAGAGFAGTRGEVDAGVGMGYVAASAEEGGSRAGRPAGAESGDRVGMGTRDPPLEAASSSRRATAGTGDAVALAALVSFEPDDEPAGDASPFARLDEHPIAPRRSDAGPSRR